MDTVYGVGDVEIQEGATLSVVLVDGVGTHCVYHLRDVASPPAELKIARPANVPPLESLSRHRDPAFIWFRLRMFADALHPSVPAVDTQGRPFYDQILKD